MNGVFLPPSPLRRGKDYKLLFILTLTHTKHLIFLSLISKNTFQFQRIEMCFSFIACLLPLDPPQEGDVSVSPFGGGKGGGK
jgi:hypothetical protein